MIRQVLDLPPKEDEIKTLRRSEFWDVYEPVLIASH
jgi:hypothetical protein